MTPETIEAAKLDPPPLTERLRDLQGHLLALFPAGSVYVSLHVSLDEIATLPAALVTERICLHPVIDMALRSATYETSRHRIDVTAGRPATPEEVRAEAQRLADAAPPLSVPITEEIPR